MAENYDVVVIGSGPGGYVAGIKAARAGLKTLVIEEDRLGGVCLNWGCIPTKALLRNAELYEEFKDAAAYGFNVSKLSFDAAKIVERSRRVADKMNKGVASLFRKYKVTHLAGSARFLAPGQLEVSGGDGKPAVVSAKDIVIATGARPKAMPQFPVDGAMVITYREALELKSFPKKLLIVGAGAIGAEFAYYFNSFGVEVHLVEMLPQLLPQEDGEIAALLLKQFQKKGIHCSVSTRVENFQAKKGGVSAVLKGEKNESKLSCDMALIAVGMEAITSELELDSAGVALENGFIKTDGLMRTSQNHIYAIGDVAGHQLLAHKASAEAEVAVAAIAGHPVTPLDYNQIPACTYCQPQVASLGMTEERCKEAGLSYKVGRFPYAASGKANASRHLDGMVKLLFGEPYGQLLGAHLIGAEVTELIAELGLAMRLEATYEEILATVHAHPTLSEAVFEATGVAYGLSSNL
ncbi:MAG: dihydrolipoyl dehydrogenase [SAR324 cluster bacterium]|nr:dihydrolipoyl dehydrogenase [SAR324 cluster bacterium]